MTFYPGATHDLTTLENGGNQFRKMSLQSDAMAKAALIAEAAVNK